MSRTLTFTGAHVGAYTHTGSPATTDTGPTCDFNQPATTIAAALTTKFHGVCSNSRSFEHQLQQRLLLCRTSDSPPPTTATCHQLQRSFSPNRHETFVTFKLIARPTDLTVHIWQCSCTVHAHQPSLAIPCKPLTPKPTPAPAHTDILSAIFNQNRGRFHCPPPI